MVPHFYNGEILLKLEQEEQKTKLLLGWDVNMFMKTMIPHHTSVIWTVRLKLLFSVLCSHAPIQTQANIPIKSNTWSVVSGGIPHTALQNHMGFFVRFQVNKKKLFSKLHVSEQLISTLMTLLTQHSATHDQSPFQNYSPSLKWTWCIDSLGQRALHSHVTHPYQQLDMFLNHPTPSFSMLIPEAIVLLMLYEIFPPGTGYFCNSLLFQYQHFSGQFTLMQMITSCGILCWCWFTALFLRQGLSETQLFKFLNILHWLLLLLS